jgi:hypothetical protein
MASNSSLEQLMTNLQNYLDAHADRPWCVHEMFEEVGARHPGEDMLVETQRALNHMARIQRIRSSGMMVERSEGVCDDWFYWSAKSPHKHLDEFGPKWQFPALSEKIQSHCRHRV